MVIVGRVGILLVALARRVTVVPNVEAGDRRLPGSRSGRRTLESPLQRATRPRREARAAGTDKAPARRWRPCFCAQRASSHAALQQLVSGRTLRLAKLGAEHDRYDRDRLPAFCAPRVPWSDITFPLRIAPLLTASSSTPCQFIGLGPPAGSHWEVHTERTRRGYL